MLESKKRRSVPDFALISDLLKVFELRGINIVPAVKSQFLSERGLQWQYLLLLGP
jgi:hypothetical protein